MFKKKIIFLSIYSVIFISCSNENSETDLTQYNNQLTIIENLNNDVPIEEIISNTSVDALYGMSTQALYISC